MADRFGIAAIAAAVLWLLAPAAPLAAEELISLQTRSGVTQSFYLTKPAGTPRAALVLFPGGDGKLRNYGPADLKRGNFLVRSRDLFVQRGFTVAVFDAPSDEGSGMTDFRTSKQHATDIAAVVAWLRQSGGAPVWLVGTSRGTISAALGAARTAGIAGLVLTSSVTRASRRERETVYDAGLSEIKIPVLVVHHRQDACPICPFADTGQLLESLAQAPRKELLAFEGGAAPRSDPCEALSAHGYLGIERQVVAAISEWIVAH
jgi:pimeloyl-ACP methyl ester carboxylesterase